MMIYNVITFIGAALVGAGVLLAIVFIASFVLLEINNSDD
jgi:hypothetical protein